MNIKTCKRCIEMLNDVLTVEQREYVKAMKIRFVMESLIIELERAIKKGNTLRMVHLIKKYSKMKNREDKDGDSKKVKETV